MKNNPKDNILVCENCGRVIEQWERAGIQDSYTSCCNEPIISLTEWEMEL